MEKTELLRLLATQDKPYTVEEWIKKLNLQSVQEIEAFNKLVLSLENDYEIMYTKKQKLILMDKSDWVKGKLTIHPKGFGFVDHQDGSLFIPPNQFKGAMHEDEVLVKPKVFADLSAEGEIVKVIKRNTTQLVGTWKRKHFEVQEARLLQKIKLLESDTSHLVEGHQCILDIVEYGNEELKVKVNRILGHVNDPGMDILTVLLNHQVPMEWNVQIDSEVEAIPMKVTFDPSEKRVDYRNRTVITIDGEDAKDFDDAISVEKLSDGYQLDVHIADVSYYITENSALDKEARRRGTSVYVVDRVVPMLPYAISNGICSLVEGEDRFTMTCSMKITLDGEIDSYEIHPSIIRSSKRMTYTNVNRMISNDKAALKKFEVLVPMIEDMLDCAHRIRERRRRDGAIDFNSVESKFILNKEKEIIKI